MARKSTTVEDELEEFDDLEVEETDEEEDLEEELEDDEEEEEPAPRRRGRPKGSTTKKKPAKSAQTSKPVFGTNELLEHVNTKTGKSLDPKALRVVLRQLAEDGVVERTVGEDRARYSFSGVNDPQVKAVVAKVKSMGTKTRGRPKQEEDDEEEETPRRTRKTPAKKPAAKKPVTRRKTTTATKKPATTRRRKPAQEELEELED